MVNNDAIYELVVRSKKGNKTVISTKPIETNRLFYNHSEIQFVDMLLSSLVK